LAGSGATQAEVNAAYDSLLAAFNGLALYVDKSGLAEMIAAAETVLEEEGSYIPSAVADLKVALAAAQAVYADPDATRDAVRDAYEALSAELEYMLKKGNRAELSGLVAIANLFRAELYTPASWEAFAEALADAQALAGDENATEREVSEARQALLDAVGALVTVANKLALLDAIASAGDILDRAEEYEPLSIAGLAAALEAAQDIYDDEDATQSEVNAARTALNAEVAKARLKERKPAPGGTVFVYVAEGKVQEDADADADEDAADVSAQGGAGTADSLTQVVISGLSGGKAKLTVAWKKLAATQKVAHYQIQYRVKGTSKWTTKTVPASKSKLTVAKLKKGKAYQVRVRAYKSVSNNTLYGPWSKVRTSGKVK
jgi:hypothetical protein